MSTEQKVALVREVPGCFSIALALRVLGLPRSTWYYHRSLRRSYEEKYAHLKDSLETIARNHSEYGYRRTTVELRERFDHLLNHKVVQRLHQLWDLPLMRGTRLPRPSGVRRVIVAAGDRVNLVRQLEVIEPFAVAYTDFTELVYGAGKAHLIAIIDHHTKVAIGWALDHRAVTEVALRAWEKAKGTIKRLGWPFHGLIVHHDQDPVFTGYGWTGRLLLKDHARVSYALNGARDNTEMESFFSRFKNENRSLFLDADDLEALRRVVDERMDYYNRERRHSSLGNKAPLDYVESLREKR
jgi:putative transposase